MKLHNVHRHKSTGHQVGMHSHPQNEIIYVVAGDLKTQAGGVAMNAMPGMLHVIPAGVEHDQSCAGPWQTICILYEADDETPGVVDTRSEYQIERWIQDILDWYDRIGSTSSGQDAVCEGLLQAIVGSVRHIVRRDATQVATHPALARALAYLHAHPTAPITHDELASIADVSGRHLTTLFHQGAGTGPIHYQQRLRMEIACRTLRNPYATISQAASDSGYDDLNYFGRLFRKVHGVSPGLWRRRHGA